MVLRALGWHSGEIHICGKHMYTFKRFVWFTCLGVKKGNRVAIYLPTIIELVVAMLACARIGAIHLVVVKMMFFVDDYQHCTYCHVNRTLAV